MTLWKDIINYKAKPISYSTFDRGNLSRWIDKPGNRERLENLKWARDHCDGIFRVIITTAKDVNADTREIEDAHYQARMIMKLVDLREETGGVSRGECGSVRRYDRRIAGQKALTRRDWQRLGSDGLRA